MQALGKDQSTPTPWPEELSGMSMLKTLYLYQEKSVHFVRAFVTMVICKVKRLEKFYIDAGECTLNAAASQPDDEAIERHRDPTKCGGSYYVNNCKPQAKLHASANDTYPEPADSEPRCNKTVRARDRKGKPLRLWDLLSTSRSQPTPLHIVLTARRLPHKIWSYRHHVHALWRLSSGARLPLAER